MTQNQGNKELAKLRTQIDQIDDKLISLLNERMEVVAKVGELKTSNGEKFFVRSAREADMIKDLVKKNNGKFPDKDIINIWRKIIAAANTFEQPLNIALCDPKNIPDFKYLVRNYYNDEVKLISCTSATSVIADLEQEKAQIAIFALPSEEFQGEGSKEWWISLANNQFGLKAYAQIPFATEDSSVRLVACAIKEPEQSRADNSLVYIEVKKGLSKDRILKALQENNIKSKILRVAKLDQVDDALFYLAEFEGFYDEKNQDLNGFITSDLKPHVKIVGHIPC